MMFSALYINIHLRRVSRAVLSILLMRIILVATACFEDDDSSSPTGPDYGYYISNVNTKHLHGPGCSYLPHQENRVYFDICAEGIDAGYHNCQHCEPCLRCGIGSRIR